MNDFSVHTMQVCLHGRYLIRQASTNSPAPLLVGFHGYGECAEDELDRLSSIPGSSAWCLCVPEALHHFYNTQGAPGSCWMTSRDRDLRIAENIHYINAVFDELFTICHPEGTVVLHGFSQGTGMACRTAVLGRYAVSGVMLLGGDIPPELQDIEKMGSVHLARGSRDPFFAETRFQRDVDRLCRAGVPCRQLTFAGNHWANNEYFFAAGEFLDSLRRAGSAESPIR